MVEMTTFGQWVKERRKLLGLTQTELARRVPCSKIMINKIEANLRRPSVQLTKLLAHHLKIPPHDYTAFLLMARPDLSAEHLETPITSDSLEPLRGLAGYRGTSPAIPPTPLVGRAKELEEICMLLQRPEVHMVTLTGPGGAGKTRLGLEVATMLRTTFDDGVYFINLSSINDSHLVLPTIAQALGVKKSQGGANEELLGNYLYDKRLLLVLDNFEQVLMAAKDIAAVLKLATSLKVLVTSRARLHIYGEYEFIVSPLEVPDLRQLISPEALLRSPAVALFVQRAQAAQAGFVLTRDNALTVTQICAHLDGLPLALELAAARIKFMSPQALLARLTGNSQEAPLDILSEGAVDLPDRHQTIRRTIDWSYQLLNGAEQRLFRRLSVFAGGFSLEAAASMSDASETRSRASVLVHLTSLVNQSLLQLTEDSDGQPRYNMLETIHEYALERLATQNELATLRKKHALFFLKLAETAQLKSEGPEQVAWLRQLETEHDNLRGTLTWCCTSPEGTEIGLRLAAALWDFWLVRGYVQEGRNWLTKILTQSKGAPPTREHAEALNGAGMLAWAQGDIQQASILLEKSLAFFRSLDDKLGSAWVLDHLGDVALHHGRYDLAVQLCSESQKLFRAANASTKSAWALLTLGNAVWAQGRRPTAIEYLNESLGLFRQLGDAQGTAWAVEYLGNIAQSQADYTKAKDLLNESLRMFREMGDKTGMAWALNHLGRLAQAEGENQHAIALFRDSVGLFYELGISRGVAWGLVGLASLANSPERAARLLGAADGLFNAQNEEMMPADRAYYEHVLAGIRLQLSTSAFDAAHSAGQLLTEDQAIWYALEQAA